MGNWRRVHLIGTCDPVDIERLREAIVLRYDDPHIPPRSHGHHCLSATGALASLPDWASETINAVGNLSERDYTVEDVERQLERLTWAAPSLSLKVHVGGDYEDHTCVATITVEKCRVSLLDHPEIEDLPPIPEGQMTVNLLRALRRF